MAFVTRPQRAAPQRSAQGHPPALAAESLPPDAETARFTGNVAARTHSKRPKIAWPEKYHERYRLPATIEEQPF